MWRPFSSAALALSTLAACQSVEAPTASTDALTPEQAIHRAAEAAPSGVPGIYAMRVQATGRRGDRIFLNSELDYRDQRNLSIALLPQAWKAFETTSTLR